ncbi:hypothetical protein Cni_G17308 [Canna indica]|uniref:Uncharacterized protein n=1 Tax=Canna indica TaxID=4628 RepID=A0AAQ3KJ17_9LILI|nr:hypothetical protein Cni_G17308 [Canna indica]
MSSLVLSGVGLKVDHVPLPGYLHAAETTTTPLQEETQVTEVVAVRKRNVFCLQEGYCSSSETSSVGDGEDEDEDEAESKKREGAFGCFDSLEESLPIKRRGLSNFFSGKSKSFVSLSDIAANAKVNELAKPENPFNKRRRILMAYKTGRASYLPPLVSPDHALDEEEEDEDDEEEEDERCSSNEDGQGKNTDRFRTSSVLLPY